MVSSGWASSRPCALAVAVVTAFFPVASAAPGPQGPRPRTYSPSALREDLGVLHRALVDGDPGIYRYTAAPIVQRAFDQAAAWVTAPMTAVQFYQIAAPLVALIRDGHANLQLPDSALAAWRAGERFLPLVIRVRHGQAFVFRDLSDPREPAAGKAIESINGVSVKRLMGRFLRATSGDGEVRTSRELDISGLAFAQDVNLLAGLHAPFTVAFGGSGSGRLAALHFNGSSRDSLRSIWRARHPDDLELRTARPASDFRLVDAGNTAILVIPSWGSSQADADKRDLRGLFKRTFATLRDSGVKALIIDVRNNGGGEDEPGRILYSYLALRPFGWYDSIIVNDTARYTFTRYVSEPDPFDPGMLRKRPDGRFDLVGESSLDKVFQPAETAFRGALFVLMNGGSFSTSTEFVAQVKANQRGVLIGDESAGGFQGNDSGLEPVVALPNSGLRLRLPLAAYYLAVGKHATDRRGVLPDVPISPTLQDYRTGKDPIMERAVAMTRQASP